MKADPVPFRILEHSNKTKVRLVLGNGVFFLFNTSAGIRNADQDFCQVIPAMEVYQATALAGDKIRALYNGPTNTPGICIVWEKAKTVRPDVHFGDFNVENMVVEIP